MQQLKRYSELSEVILKAQKEMNDIKEKLEKEVLATGQISAHGYTARMKPGRKSINHEAAAKSAGVSYDVFLRFTTIPSPRTSWAKVTKEAGVHKDILRQHTALSPPSFVIEKNT